jgi:mannose-6-phosphate isomerase-like protein (cupin superfamily)
MPGHTMVNLGELEDMGPKFGFEGKMQARFARKPLELEHSGVSHFRLASGYRQPFGHTHSAQEEIYLLLSGSARLKLDDDILELRPLDAVRIAAGTTRQLEAGPDGCELIAFGAPNTDNKDIDMTPNWWAGE